MTTGTPTDALHARLADLDGTLRTRVLPRRPDPVAELRDLASYAEGLPESDRAWDVYGEKGPVAALERRVAELLGKPAAAFFPSGVMAQQAALRAWCDRASTRRIALPDLSHLLLHEDDGPRRLHGFDVEALTTGAVVATAADVERLPGRLGAVLVELPLRDGGYLLPSWDELEAVSRACRARGVALHLDGARLWESAPFWGRSPADVAALGDSVYVSFYKGLAGMAGAALAGSADVVDEARVWRRRHGGTLFTMAPYALGALRGLDRQLPRMGECHAYAVALGAAVQEAGFRVVPQPVQAVAFRAWAPLSAHAALERVVALADDEKLGLPARWRDGDLPGWSFTEVTVSPAMIDAWPDPTMAAAVLGRLLA